MERIIDKGFDPHLYSSPYKSTLKGNSSTLPIIDTSKTKNDKQLINEKSGHLFKAKL
jgi:hypothetical protein